MYHNFVTKALFANNISMPDIHNTVEFLSMLVRASGKYDWKKLVRMMSYLCGTPELPLNICADITNIFEWCVDVSHGVKSDFKLHTSSNQSQVQGYNISTSTNKNLNTRRSTEIELVAAAGIMPYAMWTTYF